MAETLPNPKDAIEQLLTSMAQFEASDLHLKVGYPPYYRIAGKLRKTHMAPLPNRKFIEDMMADMIPEVLREEYETAGAIDFSAKGHTGDRYRINMFRASGDVHVAIRRVQSKIPSFASLHLPQVYEDAITNNIDGLVLISGVTGSGKSSTMAAMVEHINQTRSVHIITIEDPIEYVFTPKKSIVSQREIGIDVPNYAEALRHIVRQDPDCILIGELCDKVTMATALQAAETGHLVLGTLHMADAAQTFTRMLEFFPSNIHGFIRSSLANSLRAIMCQKLIPGMEEGKRFPATEVLLNNALVKEKIINAADEDLSTIIATSSAEGMRNFTTSLCELIETEKVYYDVAMEYAPNREALKSAIKGIQTASKGLIGRR